MIVFAVGVGLGAALGGIVSGFFWAQFIYTHSKMGENDVR